jgi:hypothetical protein
MSRDRKRFSKAQRVAAKIVGWAKLDVVLRQDYVKRDILLARPGARHRMLRGASKSQLERLVAFGRRWVEAINQTRAKEGAARFREELLADARGELDRSFREAAPQRENETDEQFEARKLHFVQVVRGRLLDAPK